MISELSKKEKAVFYITDEWYAVDEVLRFIGHPSEIVINPTMCGLIVDSYKDAFKDYVHKGKSVKAVESFKSLLSSIGIKENKYSEYQIYKEII